MKVINWYLNELSAQVISLIGVAIVLAIIFVIAGNYFKKLDVHSKPNKRAMLVFMYYEFIDNLCTSVFRGHVKKIKPYAGTLFILILASNYLPIILPLAAPTTDYNVPLGLVIISMTIMYSVDFKYNGVISHMKGYFEPLKVMFPLNLMGIVSTPLSMSMRLFVNILSGSIIVSLFYFSMNSIENGLIGLFINQGPALKELNVLGAVVALPLHIYFDFFAGALQAFVFTLLTLVFTSQSLDLDQLDENERQTTTNVTV